MNILFVCTGNISRSYLAKTLLLNDINKSQVNPGTAADQEMINFLREKEIPEGEHYSRMISNDDIDWADLILVMEEYHYDYLVRTWPESEHKIEMLGKYITPDQPDDEIIDPYGRSPYHYRLAQSQIMLAVSNLLKTISDKK